MISKGLVCLLVLLSAAQPAHALSPVRSLILENRLEEAIGLCRQYELLSTSDNDNFLACAWVYARSERVESAEKLLERMRRSSQLPEFQLVTAFIKMQRKRFDEAKRILDPLVVEHKGSNFALTVKEVYAEYYELLGQLSTAAFFYKQVVADDPKRARSQWGLARYYLGQGDTARAISHLENTAKLWPKHIGSRYNLAVLQLSLDNVREGARLLAEAHKINRADVGVLEQLGILFEKKGMIAEAVRHWQKALDLKSDSPIAKEKLAMYSTQVVDTLIEQGKYAQALRQLDIGASAMADQPAMLRRRGIINRNLGNYEKGAADLKAYFQSKPEVDGVAARELGICYLNLKLMDQAREYFNKAIGAEPGNGINHAWLAYVLEAKGDWEGARDRWRSALDLLKEPKEIQKATRKLAAIEKRIGKAKRPKKEEKMDMGLTNEVEQEANEEMER